MDDDHSEDSEDEEEPNNFDEGSTVAELDSTDDEEDALNAEGEGNDDQDRITALVYHHRRDIRSRRLDDLVYLVFGRSTRSVPEAAFSECQALQNVTFCEGLQTIGKKAFRRCLSLRTISFPKSLKTIEEWAFLNCGLESIELNEGLQCVGVHAFAFCLTLKKIKLPSTLNYIFDSSFVSCGRLEHVDFGTGVKIIGRNAFFDCASLTVIHLPNSVQVINSYAFGNCTSLLSVEFPSTGLRTVDANAFAQCNVLTNAVVSSSPIEIAESCFSICGRLEEMFLPEFAHNPYNRFYASIKRRYDRFPIHEFCYKQSYLPRTTALGNLIALLNSESSSDDNILQRVDAAGMSAFHILALSSQPEIGLFQILQAYSCPSRRHMEVPDRWGIRPIQYMCSNSRIPMSDRTRLVEYLAEATVMHRAHKLGLPSWRVAVISKAREVLFADAETMTLQGSQRIDKIYQVLERYELMEMLSSLELRIWYWKILLKESHEKSEDTLDDRHPKRIKFDGRESARVNCGADIIVGNVLTFLRTPSYA
ncbi:unnamed protein product [Cylindrotheca closterium]|uniref:Uncharacterized protein n=1 Tax=Cylindrotheca closterium TaxID=2856 RepID=A0AAD2G6Z1_9STRA|nr:unnamed protein product [Cylindrotheca closterium]